MGQVTSKKYLKKKEIGSLKRVSFQSQFETGDCRSEVYQLRRPHVILIHSILVITQTNGNLVLIDVKFLKQ